jgi:GNAT superfamily N-acetyltransferase
LKIEIRALETSDFENVVALQSLAFEPPFDPDLLWKFEHLASHLAKFPNGQWVAEVDGVFAGSCSNSLISEDRWQAHADWDSTVGGPTLETFDEAGSTLYGLDISVHPNFRGNGVGRAFYQSRFELVRSLSLSRYGTACRIPDFQKSGLELKTYIRHVLQGERVDRTLTPLLRYGLTYIETLTEYMEDAESSNVAALLEWRPS